MARRRRVTREEPSDRVVREDVEEVYEQPLPPPRSNPWPWLLLLGLLVAGGLAGLWYWQNEKDDEPARTVVVQQTVTNGETQPPATATETETVAEPTTGEVPAVVGQGHEDAGAAVEAAGFKADTYPVASAEPRGTVVAQTPESGASAQEGETVRLNVSLGEGARAAREVPDVTGPKESDARASARAAGFTVRTVDRKSPTSEELGEVLTQEPAAGATAPELAQITLYVGR